MSLSIWLRHVQRHWFVRRPTEGAPRRGQRLPKVARRVQLQVESLEERLTPSVVTITVNDNRDVLDNSPTVTVSGLGSQVTLRDAINAANNTGGSNEYVINLHAFTTYLLTQVDNNWYGPNGLPAIASAITINGNGATIERDHPAPNSGGTPEFRLFYVSNEIGGLGLGTLTLNDLTLEGGVARGGNSDYGGGGLGAGGAIFNQGLLILNRVTLTNNQAIGGSSSVLGIGAGGGGGMGQSADGYGNGGGFGGNFPNGMYGGTGGAGDSNGDSGGGGGFWSGTNGGDGRPGGTSPPTGVGGNGGGQGGFGGAGGGGKSYDWHSGTLLAVAVGGTAGDGGGAGGSYPATGDQWSGPLNIF
jgi:hypothetical protein